MQFSGPIHLKEAGKPFLFICPPPPPLSLSVEGSSQPGRRQPQRLPGLPPQRGPLPSLPPGQERPGLSQSGEASSRPWSVTERLLI